MDLVAVKFYRRCRKRQFTIMEVAVGGSAAVPHLQEDGRALRVYRVHHLAPRSSFSLRQAVRAARSDFALRIRAKLESVERQYLDELMAGLDPVEGLNAFQMRIPSLAP